MPDVRPLRQQALSYISLMPRLLPFRAPHLVAVLGAAALAAVTTACGSSGGASSVTAWCPATPFRSFGPQRLRGLFVTLQSPDGPVANANVRYKALAGSTAVGLPWASGFTGTDGFFFVTDLQPGTWAFEVCAPGLEGLRGTVEIDESTPVSAVTFFLQPHRF